MSGSVVWCAPPERLPEQVARILLASEFFDRTKPRKRLGIKLHFGEAGNHNHIEPEVVRQVVVLASRFHLEPFLIETTSLYRGRRATRREHIKLACEHGFDVKQVLAPIDILDGEFGEKFYTVAMNSTELPKAFLAAGLRYYSYIINLAHFKGHFVTGFGGTIKNLAMGLASKAGKLAMHSSSKPYVDEVRCASCGACVEYCPHQGISFVRYVAKISSSCTGCGGCVAVCPHGAIKLKWDLASDSVQTKMADYCQAVLTGRAAIHFNLAVKITPNCDCNSVTEKPMMPDLGVFGSFDPVACDQAVFDRAREKIKECYPELDPEILLARAAEIGLGSRNYQLVPV